MRLKTDEDPFEAYKTLIDGLACGTITGKLWIIQRGRIREYQPDRDDED